MAMMISVEPHGQLYLRMHSATELVVWNEWSAGNWLTRLGPGEVYLQHTTFQRVRQRWVRQEQDGGRLRTRDGGLVMAREEAAFLRKIARGLPGWLRDHPVAGEEVE